MQRQIDSKGLKVKEGVIQDATFITADPGHQRVNEPRGPEAKPRRNKEGEWTKENGNPIMAIITYFGQYELWIDT
ncbi:hypothetical protein JCM15415_07440 [Methanobacterium movens]